LSAQTRTSYTYIEKDLELKSLVALMRGAQRIALDTEADSLHHYFEKVCLIQLTLDEGNFIVDPLARLDLAPFIEALARKPLILHGADYDLRILHAAYGFRPGKGVFDTMLAAQLLGYEQLGLAALVQRFHDVELIKQNQRFDWSKRPLPSAQLAYASDDTRFLPDLADRLEAELDRLGRVGWHGEACNALIDVTCRERSAPDPDGEWRIKGSSTLRRRQLAILRQLWYWREKAARKADLPPFKILGNNTLLDLAVWADHYPKRRLEQGPRLPRNLVGRRFADLSRSVNRGRNLERPEWPPLRRKNAQKRVEIDMRRFERLRKALASAAKELKIAPSTIAPRAALEAVVLNEPKTRDEILACTNLVPWQAEMLARILFNR
jgi:ribonuclease D